MLAGLLACSNGGTPANNFTAEAVEVITSDPRIGFPLKVSVQVKADRPANNVGVSLFAIDSTSDPDIDVRQIPLGTNFIEDLPAGSSNHELSVTIPSSVEFAGPYHIAVVVDPVDLIVERDEEDNASTTEVNLGVTNAPNILLADVALDRAALIINTIKDADEYDEQVGVDDVYNADAGGTITIGADGLGVDETVDIEAFANLRIIRNDIGTTHDVPLYLWNSAEQSYINAYGINGDVEWLPMGTFTPQLAEIIGDEVELDDVTRNSEHMDFYFPGRLGYELEQALRYPPPPCDPVLGCPTTAPPPTMPPPDLTADAIDDLEAFLTGLPFSGIDGDESVSLAALDFTVCVKIRPTDPMVSDSIAADNKVCTAIEIFLPPLPPGTITYNIGEYDIAYEEVVTASEPLSSGDGFATKNNNKQFAFNLDFGIVATADDRGYIEEVTAGIPVKVFGSGFDFMRITARAQLVPDYYNKPASEQSGFSYEIRFLNQVIDSLPPTTLAYTGTKMEYSKEVKKEKQFFVGPVPMIAGGSIGGNFGIEYTLGYDDKIPTDVVSDDFLDDVFGSNSNYVNDVISLGASIGPFANLEAGMLAGVGTDVFAVGVEGVVTLLDERIVYFIGTTIEVLSYGTNTMNDAVEFIITQGQKLTNTFTGPVGKLNLFAKYTVPKVTTCKGRWFRYICIKQANIKTTKNIYSTPALFHREDILFQDNFAQLVVVILDETSENDTPAYYTPVAVE